MQTLVMEMGEMERVRERDKRGLQGMSVVHSLPFIFSTAPTSHAEMSLSKLNAFQNTDDGWERWRE